MSGVELKNCRVFISDDSDVSSSFFVGDLNKDRNGDKEETPKETTYVVDSTIIDTTLRHTNAIHNSMIKSSEFKGGVKIANTNIIDKKLKNVNILR